MRISRFVLVLFDKRKRNRNETAIEFHNTQLGAKKKKKELIALWTDIS